jgi:hypothetical protein
MQNLFEKNNSCKFRLDFIRCFHSKQYRNYHFLFKVTRVKFLVKQSRYIYNNGKLSKNNTFAACKKTKKIFEP